MQLFQRDLFAAMQRLMQMDEVSGQRHASPWSVYSRMTILPLLTLALLSRHWLGWGALVPVAMVVLWTWWNPRAFRAPTDRTTWASEGTFGERVLLNRKQIAIPAHHRAWARGLALASALGLPPWIYGVLTYNSGYILLGLCLLVGGKLWFVDRMVWLYRDMKPATAVYAAWQDDPK
ncbi:hypothetical protein RSK20926_09527 [Roseobacter sp. SK209-2-6]|uniref:DUF6653 family protein n=1 Tax=Roseobacter sp. SK209-2-6 TaxID=388739 RepID=UPI0000F3D220|nr:DUF6653 family protein [Roseobacter sp. SK209-2-6]EBA17201.1 hypothetical protein RSK20926_09527 [Roseobacter sp. SK209-2-6]